MGMTVLQIGGNRGADIMRQWHGGDLPSLAPNGELTRVPFDIISLATSHARNPNRANSIRIA